MTSSTSTDAVALLRELEWSAWSTYREGQCCPVCRRVKSGGRHSINCRLAKAIAEQPAEAVGDDAGDALAAALEKIIKLNQVREWMGDDKSDGYGDQGWITRDGQYAQIARDALRTRIETEDRAKSGGEVGEQDDFGEIDVEIPTHGRLGPKSRRLVAPTPSSEKSK